MDKQQKWHAWYFLAAIMGVALLGQVLSFGHKVADIPYSQFLDDLKSGKIVEVSVAGDFIDGQWKVAAEERRQALRHHARRRRSRRRA